MAVAWLRVILRQCSVLAALDENLVVAQGRGQQGDEEDGCYQDWVDGGGHHGEDGFGSAPSRRGSCSFSVSHGL